MKKRCSECGLPKEAARELMLAEQNLDRAHQELRIILGQVRRALGYPKMTQPTLGTWGASKTHAMVQRIGAKEHK